MSNTSGPGEAKPAAFRRTGRAGRRRAPGRRAFWMKQAYAWHWISAGLCLIGMVFFAVTGITLNHAGEIETRASTESEEAALPADLLASIADGTPQGRTPLAPALGEWLSDRFGLGAGGMQVERVGDELYLSLPRPGGDAWLSIDLADGLALYERTDRGWIAYLNDLHKGRDTSTAWQWFIDVFAAACLVFSITGLFLLYIHSGKRQTTWPIVGLGLAIPILLIVFSIH